MGVRAKRMLRLALRNVTCRVPRRVARLVAQPGCWRPNRKRVFTSRAESQWDQLLSAAATQANAQCDVGWAYHQGTAPGGQNIGKAVEQYESAAAQGYSPAASLLADLHYLGHDLPTDDEQANMWLLRVLELTDEAVAEDAYVRAKALQKLGTLAWRREGAKDTSAASQYFKQSIELCQKYLRGGWAFLLAHDPPGLWENLEVEIKLLQDGDKLTAGLNQMASAGQVHEGEKWRWESDNAEDYVSDTRQLLLPYTAALRAKENDASWLLNQQLESLAHFPKSNEGAWGVTYFQTYFRVFHQLSIQKAIRSMLNSQQAARPKVVVLGSALGGACFWPALAFGFRAVGFELLPGCVEEAKALASKGEPLLKFLHERSGQSGEPQSVAEFRCVDVVEQSEEVQLEMADAAVVWVNDYAWPTAAQQRVEEMALHALPTGGVLVLYRPPHSAGYLRNANETPGPVRWVDGGRVRAATSWDPELEMHILIKDSE